MIKRLFIAATAAVLFCCSPPSGEMRDSADATELSDEAAVNHRYSLHQMAIFAPE